MQNGKRENENNGSKNEYLRTQRSHKVCHDCFKPIQEGSRCPSCLERENSRQKKKRLQFINEGKCYICGSEKLPHSPLCEKHFLVGMSKKAFGRKRDWELLKKQFEKQNGLCFFTGQKLILGLNASVDFKSEREPVWCLTRIAQMKKGIGAREFVLECQFIADNFFKE